MPVPRRSRLAVGAVVVAMTLAGCGDAPTAPASGTPAAAGFPVSVIRCGHVSTFTAPPERVVLGWATSVRTLDALGMARKVTGYVSGANAQLPAGFTATEVSPDFKPAKEALLAARPDLFLANDENQLSGAEGTAGWADLEAVGGKGFVLGGYCLDTPAPATLDAVYTDIRDLGAVFGVRDRADTIVADLTRRVSAAAAKRGTVAPARVAVVQVYDGKVYALAGSYYNAILDGAGLTNVFASLGQNFAEISPEQVLTAKPDAIVAVHEEAGGAGAAVDAARTAFAATPAVAAGKVVAMSNVDISGGGVDIVDLVEQAATAVYGP
ncbi:ABC transporter substrate-binding protein [Pseudonocardia sp. N23]|uniref:ABC transporter substrate-binding protein n=1 Tax=Pseudonocardia sp. N23 TaxID=1987376 RepID=UPI0011451CB6|nr:ABC transporter substrate-binding protein [Pseudonocardia sp. N23]